jgi:uncharacterized protein YndB with AHSA1/START domain
MRKFLKWFLGTLALVAAVIVVGGMFLNPNFNVSRGITIAAPPEKVFPLIANPRHWKQWSVWNQRDPDMAISYDGPESGNGAKWTWKSRSEGDGSMTFKNVEANRSVGYDLYFPDFGTTSTGELRLAPEGGGTRVTWTMNGNMGSNPLFRWIALASDSMIGKDFEAGLARLKNLAEKT